MLFSDNDLADYMSKNFECAWQELRPVPKARIDFGNGRVLVRTLAGNVATWICMPTGVSASESATASEANVAIDVIPALFTREQYQARLEAAHALHAAVRDLDGAATVLTDWHRQRAALTRNRAVPGRRRRAVTRLGARPQIGDGTPPPR